MGHGVLTPAQEKALEPFVSIPVVHDLGAGDMALSRALVRLGATQVIAIDKEPTVRRAPPGVLGITSYFENYSGPIDTAFISWPRNTYDMGLIGLLLRSRIVIYLGKNTDGTACGYPQLWHHLVRREVLLHAPDRHNTLIVYGGMAKEPRRFLGEEYAAVFQDRVWKYDEIQQLELPLVTRPIVIRMS